MNSFANTPHTEVELIKFVSTYNLVLKKTLIYHVVSHGSHQNLLVLPPISKYSLETIDAPIMNVPNNLIFSNY